MLNLIVQIHALLFRQKRHRCLYIVQLNNVQAFVHVLGSRLHCESSAFSFVSEPTTAAPTPLSMCFRHRLLSHLGILVRRREAQKVSRKKIDVGPHVFQHASCREKMSKHNKFSTFHTDALRRVPPIDDTKSVHHSPMCFTSQVFTSGMRTIWCIPQRESSPSKWQPKAWATRKSHGAAQRHSARHVINTLTLQRTPHTQTASPPNIGRNWMFVTPKGTDPSSGTSVSKLGSRNTRMRPLRPHREPKRDSFRVLWDTTSETLLVHGGGDHIGLILGVSDRYS